MLGVRTNKTTGIYGAPHNAPEGSIDGLPFHREPVDIGGVEVTSVTSYWKPTAEELDALAAGALIEVRMLGEPIPPIAINIADDDVEEV